MAAVVGGTQGIVGTVLFKLVVRVSTEKFREIIGEDITIVAMRTCESMHVVSDGKRKSCLCLPHGSPGLMLMLAAFVPACLA